MSAHPVTTGTDIPLWQQIRQKAQGSTDCAFWMAVADEVKRLTLSATASGELVHELRDALKSLSDMYAFPGESNTERFERVAERFYAETGVIAPGKDVSAGGWNGMTYEDRVKRFEDWYAEKAANARAAMEKANG